MRLHTLTLVAALALLGCSATPKTLKECSTLYSTSEEVEACEERVLKAEDQRAWRKAEEQAHEQRARACWERGQQYYDRNTGRCFANLW
jgi:hypothetical protein